MQFLKILYILFMIPSSKPTGDFTLTAHPDWDFRSLIGATFQQLGSHNSQWFTYWTNAGQEAISRA